MILSYYYTTTLVQLDCDAITIVEKPFIIRDNINNKLYRVVICGRQLYYIA